MFETKKKQNREMKYIKPHLSPELRAQITPYNRRDQRSIAAGVFFLLLSGVLFINLLPNGDKELSLNNNAENTIAQTPALSETDKQVLGETTAQTQPNESEFTSYTVKNGDTLFNISQQYNIKWDLIAEINNLSEPYMVHGGQILKIPQATTSAVLNKIYTIQNGDTLASIARKYNITVNDIIAVNPNLQQSDLITAGQVIKLP